MKIRIMEFIFAVISVALYSAAADAQVVVLGGGDAEVASLYAEAPDGVFPANFSYHPTNSVAGRNAFLTNDSTLFPGASGTVHYAGSVSLLTQAHINTYKATYNIPGDPGRYGPLIQVPSVAMAIAVPYNNGNAPLNLTDAQLCGIFSGRITNWSVISSSRSGAINVVYHEAGSGTTEILTRFLSTVCPVEVDTATFRSKLVNNRFVTTTSFASLFDAGQIPAGWVAASRSEDAYSAVYAQVNRIGYTGPDVIQDLADASKVAQLRGFSPDEVSEQATLRSQAPPTGAAAADPLAWVPVFTNPYEGYPIVGYSTLYLGQCYKDSSVAVSIRNTMLKHYTGGDDSAIRAHGFIPLTTAWRQAVAARFLLATSSAAINNASTCAGIGRP